MVYLLRYCRFVCWGSGALSEKEEGKTIKECKKPLPRLYALFEWIGSLCASGSMDTVRNIALIIRASYRTIMLVILRRDAKFFKA